MTDPQDPLPEPSFRFRRIMAFAVVAVCLLLVWRLTYLIPAVDVLGLAQALLLFAGFMLLLWAGGASATDIAGVLAALKLRLRGPWSEPAPEASPTPPKDD